MVQGCCDSWVDVERYRVATIQGLVLSGLGCRLLLLPEHVDFRGFKRRISGFRGSIFNFRVSRGGCRAVSPPAGKRKSNYHGARPVPLIITMIKWIRTSRLSIENSLFTGAPLLTFHVTITSGVSRGGCRVVSSSLLLLYYSQA